MPFSTQSSRREGQRRLSWRRVAAIFGSRGQSRGEDIASGWAGDGAVKDQIDATVEDAVKRARSRLRAGPGLAHCEECDAAIPAARRAAVPGVRLCVACQEARDREQSGANGINRRGSKDSQLR
jgi:phage/conjugal plasmid C-4 type zinc finger TraR family protein